MTLSTVAKRVSAAMLAPVVIELLVHAQGAPPRPRLDRAVLDAIPLRLIGPSAPSGRVWNVVGVPGQPKTFYACTAEGGVWRTTNHGTTIRPIFDEENAAVCGAVAVAPSDPNVVYAGTGEGNPRNSVSWGNGVFVGRNSILSCKNGDIELADGVNIGFNCEVFSASRVRIGARVLMAAYSYVIGGDHDFSDPSQPVLEQSRRSAGVSVGNGAWIGAGAKILDGVTIGEGAVVGAAAVVRDDVPARAVAVGIPARIVSTR